MRDLDCKYITSDSGAHINTCILKKLKNERLEDKFEDLNYKNSFVASYAFDDMCDRCADCGFCQKTSKVKTSLDVATIDLEASKIADDYVSSLSSDDLRNLYIFLQKKRLNQKIDHFKTALDDLKDEIDSFDEK